MKLVLCFVAFFMCRLALAENKVVATDPDTGEKYYTGLLIPEGAFKDAPRATFTDKELSDLPDTYETKETPVKNQGQCGSCSHFASTAVYEHLLLAKLGTTPNLSEQSLLNCARYGNYQCNGSFQHFKYLVEAGQPLEEDFPYVARAQRCQAFQSAFEKPVSWGVIGASGRATVDEVRAAIVRYGSLWITVAAGNAWGKPGSVYRCTRKGSTNHAVTVTGYKPDPDRKGQFLFHIKNSWGSTWNGDGHVWMNLGCDNLGETVSYLQLKQD